MNFSRKLLPFPRQEELEILGCVNNWFIHTKLYKNNLESFVKGQGMTLGFVWLFHILYFIFGVKNQKLF